MATSLRTGIVARVLATALSITLSLAYVTGANAHGLASPAGPITVAGGTFFGGDGGPALAAHLGHVQGVTRGPDGSLYVADTDNHRVRKVATNGTISTVAGTGVPGYGGEGGQATAAQLNYPIAVAAAPASCW